MREDDRLKIRQQPEMPQRRAAGLTGTRVAYASPAISIHSAMISSVLSLRWQYSFVNFAASGKIVCATPS